MSFGTGSGVTVQNRSRSQKNDSDHLWTTPCKLAGLMTSEEKASYKDSFAKFNAKKEKLAGFRLEKTFFHTLENNIKFLQVFV